jgi:hypothetical protein
MNFVEPCGIGKPSGSMQQDILWSLGFLAWLGKRRASVTLSALAAPGGGCPRFDFWKLPDSTSIKQRQTSCIWRGTTFQQRQSVLAQRDQSYFRVADPRGSFVVRLFLGKGHFVDRTR